jgi:hypothetical protein
VHQNTATLLAGAQRHTSRSRAGSAAPRLQTPAPSATRRSSVPPAPLATSDIAALVATYERCVLERNKHARLDGRISAEAKAAFARHHLVVLMHSAIDWPSDQQALVLQQLADVTPDECRRLALMCGFGATKLPQRAAIAYSRQSLADAVSAATAAAAPPPPVEQ